MSRPVFDRLEPRFLLMAQLVADIAPGPDTSQATPGAAVAETVYFTANLNSREELWKSDGTAAGTVLVAALPAAPSDVLTDWASANGRVFFIVPNGATQTLWSSDGSEVGTRPLHEINWPATEAVMPPSDPDHVVAAGDRVYFLHRPDAATLELWRSDGTPAGTARVKAFAHSGATTDFSGVDVNGIFYFKLGELWKTDGTDAGTTMIDLSPGPADSVLHSLTNVNGTLFFAGTLFQPGGDATGVFRSDGTAAGTVQLADIEIEPQTFEMEVVGDTVYFPGSATDVNQLELWKSDGTGAGTGPVFSPRPGAINPHYLTSVGNALYFFVEGGANGAGLWKTNGTDSGTRFIKTVDPLSSAGPFPFLPGAAAEAHGKLLFVDSARGLWQSDGTSFGTAMVEGLDSVRGLVPAGTGDVFFHAAQAGTGGELWRFDATEPPSAHVMARRIVYNNSAFDGRNPAANAADDTAVDTRKTAMLPGSTAGFQNITTYAKGINGIMVDIDGLPEDIVLNPGDFVFRAGTSLDVSAWAAGPEPSQITVRPGAGLGGSDRVTLIWPDFNPLSAAAGQAVANGWLEVTVTASQRTGLLRPDVFYVGSLIGETAVNAGVDRRVVDRNDYLLARARTRVPANATVTDPFDFNRDQRVDAQDFVIVRSFLGKSMALITAPEPLAMPSSASVRITSASPAATELVRRRAPYRPGI